MSEHIAEQALETMKTEGVLRTLEFIDANVKREDVPAMTEQVVVEAFTNHPKLFGKAALHDLIVQRAEPQPSVEAINSHELSEADRTRREIIIAKVAAFYDKKRRAPHRYQTFHR